MLCWWDNRFRGIFTKRIIFTLGFTSQKHIKARSGKFSHFGLNKTSDWSSVETNSAFLKYLNCTGIVRHCHLSKKLKSRCRYVSTNESGRLAPPERGASDWSTPSAASLKMLVCRPPHWRISVSWRLKGKERAHEEEIVQDGPTMKWHFWRMERICLKQIQNYCPWGDSRR